MKKKNVLLVVLIVSILISIICFFNHSHIMINLSKYDVDEIKKYATKNNLGLTIAKKYDKSVPKDTLISQSIKVGRDIKGREKLTVVISLGPISKDVYIKYNVNELGNVPIMMYHHIVDVATTNYIGGNVDKDGYSRTKQAFINDLEYYYKNDYRMIRLVDYINGDIKTEIGKSPIILTFDDGNKDNINIIGEDDKGNIIIDPNSAVGVLESFKQKYPDFKVTATFFVNDTLFHQTKYNNKILEWLVSHDYDIGNHTKDHIDFTKVDSNDTQYQVAYIYQHLDGIIKGKYQHIVALPFGSPYNKTNPNFVYILSGQYNGYKYTTDATLRVGWDADYSPFNKNFDKTFIKRIRAYDNNGSNYDIEACFKALKNSRYISDGDKDTIVIKDNANLNTSIKNKKIIKY